MRKVSKEILGLMDPGLVILRNSNKGLRYVGETPLSEDEMQDIRYCGDAWDLCAVRLDDLEKINWPKDLDVRVGVSDDLLVRRWIDGEIVGRVVSKFDIDLEVMSWGQLEVYRLGGME